MTGPEACGGSHFDVCSNVVLVVARKDALAAGELCVCDLSEVLGLSVSATSHQRHSLRNLRLVRARSEGNLMHCALSDRFVVALLEGCTRHVQREAEKR